MKNLIFFFVFVILASVSVDARIYKPSGGVGGPVAPDFQISLDMDQNIKKLVVKTDGGEFLSASLKDGQFFLTLNKGKDGYFLISNKKSKSKLDCGFDLFVRLPGKVKREYKDRLSHGENHLGFLTAEIKGILKQLKLSDDTSDAIDRIKKIAEALYLTHVETLIIR